MNQYEKRNMKLQELSRSAGCSHFTFWVSLTPFTCGTLEIPEVMEAVTGQVFASREPTPKDIVRDLIQDCVYPGMTPAKGETTSGRLYEGVDSKTLHILDEFEDERYRRELLTVQTQEGDRFEAFSYIIPFEQRGILRVRHEITGSIG